MNHITTLTLRLKSENDSVLPKRGIHALGPMLQSVLMEHTDSCYAGILHESVFNPYSQYCFMQEDGNLVWRICALTDEAANNLIAPISKVESFRLRNLDADFSVVKANTEVVSLARLLETLKDDVGPVFRMSFMTPTAFKSKGRYVIVPDTRLIFQNLLMRYNQIYAGDNEIDDDTITYIVEHANISSYNLKSRYFQRAMGKEGKIPAFMGSLTLHVSGPRTLRGLVAMLLSFGERSGVGIKTSMGMGGLRLSQPPSLSGSRASGKEE